MSTDAMSDLTVRPTFEQATSVITRIANMQAELLDHTGHVTRGMSRDDRRIVLDEIQRLRGLVGWSPLDMSGRTRRSAP